ncbi:unnamed protein product [Bursaphelenchus okinawaensis]|uniref:Uncharacterized protein n=1 Tax=Bursaphelenchus okinawaensis TaxID=465554 RepID=A0A811JTC8_9BILA|nr:unnamed protein product [Bursaphelenchus okinawaensis]CAG9082882.1 unnamed protein product [Bursaphelenchus okinawaensis]
MFSNYLFKRSAYLLKSIRKAHTQGEYVGNVRHYFYFLDHEGQLFLEDARIKNFTSCYKDKKFLTFFLRRLALNNSGQYPEFPYISECQGELNFLKCDDRPYVFTTLDEESNTWIVNNSNRKVAFEPSKLCMFPNGRLYHPSPFEAYGLVRSAIAEALFRRFRFGDDGIPVEFEWQGRLISLTNGLLIHRDN